MDQRPNFHNRKVDSGSNGEPTIGGLRSEMAQTRAALADKLETLQEKVHDTVETAKHAVDPRYQTQQRPWVMVGLSVLAGCTVGYLTRSRRYVAAPTRLPAAPEPAREPHEEGPGAQILHELKGAAIGVGMALARDLLKEAAPSLAEPIELLMDGATRGFGGIPIEKSILDPPEGKHVSSANGVI